MAQNSGNTRWIWTIKKFFPEFFVNFFPQISIYQIDNGLNFNTSP